MVNRGHGQPTPTVIGWWVVIKVLRPYFMRLSDPTSYNEVDFLINAEPERSGSASYRAAKYASNARQGKSQRKSGGDRHHTGEVVSAMSSAIPQSRSGADRVHADGKRSTTQRREVDNRTIHLHVPSLLFLSSWRSCREFRWWKRGDSCRHGPREGQQTDK